MRYSLSSILLVTLFSLSIFLFLFIYLSGIQHLYILGSNIKNNTILSSSGNLLNNLTNPYNSDIIINNTIGSNNTSDFIVYSNSTYKIKIDYPDGWTVREDNTSTIFHDQGTKLNIVAEIFTPIQSYYYSPYVGATHNSVRLVVEDYDTFGDYINDNIQKYLGNKDSEEENRKKLLTIANKRIGAIGMFCHGFDLKSWDKNFTLSGYPAHQIFFDYSFDKNSKDAMEVWAIKDDKIYIIEFIAQDKYYEQYLPEVNAMIKSFQILG